MLSASATFAADDNADAIAVDEIADESLAVEDSPVLSAGDSITNATFYNYFDESGSLLANVTSTELTFSGDISDVGVDTITIDRAIKITGDNATITNIAIKINASDVVNSGLTINQDNNAAAIIVSNASNVQIENNKIDFKAIEGADGYAINADLAENLKLIGNTITYVGTTTGYGINNGIRVSNSDAATIKGNKFTLNLISAPVGWAEVPAGSGNWVSSPVSEGIVIDASKNVTFEDNDVNMDYTTSTGSYDTIYAVDFKDSNNAVISKNNITANGHTYIYGIILSGDNFAISENNITSVSDNYYANGIDIEGPATGVVKDNAISATGFVSAYPIYSGMNGQNVTATYTGNTISGAAYNVFGMSLGDVESNVAGNTISLIGNYTTGIAYRGSNLVVDNNTIALFSSEQGNESIWEGFGVESVGIKVVMGNASIVNNIIDGQGKGVSLTGSTIELSKNNITVTATEDKDAYAIYANSVEKLTVKNNDVDYTGSTAGTGINNAVYITDSDNAVVSDNKFNLSLVSCYVPWAEVPAGSGNWVSSPVSEGIVIDSSDAVAFKDNDVSLVYNSVSGSYDTIYAVDFKNSNNAVIEDNEIDVNGHTYIYGIIISGDNFTISKNNIKSSSDNYYANGIDVEGPASGVIKDNEIATKGSVSAYSIYSGMNGQSVSVNYTNNTISGEAYNVFGMSLGDVESNIVDNTITLKGNYTTGIAFRGGKLTAEDNTIDLTSSEEGSESIWEAFGVETVGIKVTAGDATINNNVITTQGKGVSLAGGEIALTKNNITVTAGEDKDAYAIYAKSVEKLTVTDNNVKYAGATNGTGINNGVYISESDNATVKDNTFDLDLISCPVNWVEEPAGSWNYVSYPISEGIVIADSDDVTFDNNTVNVKYTNVTGAYDTIYSVDFKNSDGAVITNNDITSDGYTYIYGIIISGEDFTITDNNITSTGDYYANGIDVEGPASGVIENNNIIAKASQLSYPIYSGMNGQAVSADIKNNNITGEAYFAMGLSLGNVESIVENNDVALKGNYTTGIASKSDKLVATNNTIALDASNEGNESIWEAFGVETVGIKSVSGNVVLNDNNITATGNYTDLKISNVDGTVVAADLKKAVGVNYTFTMTFMNLNGTALANTNVTVIIINATKELTTDANGAVSFTQDDIGTEIGNYTISASNPLTGEAKEFTITVVPRLIVVSGDLTADYLENPPYIVQALDDDGNPVGEGENVTVVFSGHYYYMQTNATGHVVRTIGLAPGMYAVKAGYKDYNTTATVFSVKQILTASSGTLKKTAKSYTLKATLKSSNGKALSGKEVKLTFNGKTYKVKTNSKGVASYTIKSSVIGKLKAGKTYKLTAKYVNDVTKGKYVGKIKVVKK